jgi:hypothetical protein
MCKERAKKFLKEHFCRLFFFAFCALLALFYALNFLKNEPTIAVVGDSYADECTLPGSAKYAIPGATVKQIEELVHKAPPHKYRQVVIIVGVASRIIHSHDFPSINAEMQSLIEACREKFAPDVIFVADPEFLVELVQHPEYLRDDIHLNERGWKVAFKHIFSSSQKVSE